MAARIDDAKPVALVAAEVVLRVVLESTNGTRKTFLLRVDELKKLDQARAQAKGAGL